MLGVAKYLSLPMNIITDGQLLDIIDSFQVRFHVKETAFGRKCNGEPGLLPTLRAGRKVSLEMANRIIGFMKDHATEHGPDWQMPSPDNETEIIGEQDAAENLVPHDGNPSGRATAVLKNALVQLDHALEGAAVVIQSSAERQSSEPEDSQ